jgi:polar amino acid transport system substrate-binding protein
MNKPTQLTLIILAVIALAAGCEKTETVIARLDDAETARIGVMTSSTGEAITTARFPKAQVKSFDDIMDAVAAMSSGQLDAIVTAYPAALQVTKKNPALGLLPEPLAYEDTAIAVKKANDELLADLNRIISELKSDGTLESMKRRWFKPDLTPYEEPGIVLPKAGTPLKIGVSATREPFSFVDKAGRVSGHDGELARIIGARLNRPVEFFNMKFMALIPALQSGKVDMIVTGMTATDERKKYVDFTQPYYANAQVMLVRRLPAGEREPAVRRVGQLASVEDLKDKRIGVLVGSAHDTYATKNYPDATILQYKTPADVALAVKTGKVDAALFDAEPLREILRQDDSLGVLEASLFSFDVGVGFKKGNEALRDQFNQFLARIKQNGTHADMIRRWMEKGDTRMPDIDNPGSNGILVAGVSDVGLPFTAVKDNRLVGFDIELAKRFAAHLGKTVEFSNMEFGSLIAAVSTGKVDMIASSVYITDERKRQINFSDPYYEMGTSVFALKKSIAAYDAGPGAATGVPSFLERTATSFRSNIMQENRYLLIWNGLKTTLVISIFSTLLGTLLGALVCFMRMSPRTVLNLPARVYINIIRGMPVLVLLMLIFYVVFASVNISPVLVAIIAFGMNFAAYVSEIFRSGIEGVGKGQIEAGIAMGFTRVKTFVFIVLPQTVQRILPVYKGEFISLVKMTSIVGYIAVQDLTKASDIIRSRTFDAFFPLVMVAILYFVIAWVLMLSLEYLERMTDPKYKRRKAARP